MSKILCCDLCGKMAVGKNKAIFSSDPLKIQLPSYNKSDLNFYINIIVEDNNDLKILQVFQNEMAKIGLYTMDDFENISPDEVEKLSFIESETVKKMKNPHPHICNNCKREVLKLALRYGSYNKMLNPIKD